MPVLRNEYTIEQFEEALQKLAHTFPKFKKVATEDITITFHYTDDGKPRRITIQHHKRTGRIHCWRCNKTFTAEEAAKHVKEKHNGETYYLDSETEWWSFSIEAKLYMDSDHATKINYTGYKEDKQRIERWLKELMGNIKPKPRFSLKQVPQVP